ncbi:hypothetical protein WMY93_028405 [Mugilogobius chulae]|uniref:BACK domain-containing protein n=1 Tax=Mugilogobius chulae TaxID=88201 RepID=A0AAW0MSQ6_9GOBI
MLLLEDLVEVAFDFMLSHMSPENCFVIWKFSAVVVSTKTRDSARRLTLQNFEELSVLQELMDFIEEDELIVKHESDVYQAIVRWANHDHLERRAELNQLLTKISYQ